LGPENNESDKLVFPFFFNFSKTIWFSDVERISSGSNFVVVDVVSVVSISILVVVFKLVVEDSVTET
jgi:hypothetical protein